jgi:hypothetical protein
MNEPAPTTTPTKPKAPPAPTPRTGDEPIRVKELRFRGGVDLPNGLPAQVSRIEAGERRRSDGTAVPNVHRFEILFVPRLGAYVVRAFAPRTADNKPGALTHEFLVPREWAIADKELTP